MNFPLIDKRRRLAFVLSRLVLKLWSKPKMLEHLLDWTLNRLVSGVPIYEQIKQQVKAAILSGELKEEEALPSLRTLAKDLKISVLTVTRAYTELEQEGFVKNVQGRGCFVLGSGSELMKEQLIRKVENSLTEAIKAAKIANLSNEELHHLLDILLEANADD